MENTHQSLNKNLTSIKDSAQTFDSEITNRFSKLINRSRRIQFQKHKILEDLDLGIKAEIDRIVAQEEETED